MQFQKKSIPTPRKVIGNSSGGGGSQNLRMKLQSEAEVEFPEGRWQGRGAKQKTFSGGSMDIFWNFTVNSSTT